MRRFVVVIAIVLLIVGLAPAAHADPRWPRWIGFKGCPAPQWPAQPALGGAADGARVLIVGDSLTRESRQATIRKLRRDGWRPTVRCWGGKRLDWGIAQIKRAKRLDQLPDTVVMALGTNDMRLIPRSITAERVRTVLDLLGPNRRVSWVTLHFEGPASPGRDKERWFNALLRQEAATRPNMTLIDWAGWARERSIRPRDGLHYRRNGNRERSEAIRQALRAGLPPAPQPQVPTDPVPPLPVEIPATRG